MKKGFSSQRTFARQSPVNSPVLPAACLRRASPPPNCNSGKTPVNAVPEGSPFPVSRAAPDSGATPQGPPYEGLAAIYDFVMRHVDYVSWASYVDTLLRKFGNGPETLVDLACGTGNATLEFSKLGYEVSGVDASAAMVAVAQGKAASIESEVPFSTGDLRSLEGFGPFDAATCLYDSFNYLMTTEDVGAALESVAGLLKPEGVFVFDICTERNSLDHFRDVRDAEEGPGFVYTRHSYYDADRRIQYNSFDIGYEDRRVCETHEQRIYEFDEMTDMIAASPLEILGAFDGFCMHPGSDRSDRVHFVLRLPP